MPKPRRLAGVLPFALGPASLLAAAAAPAAAADGVQPAEMAGYLLVPTNRVPDSYNAGFSMYVAAWPLLDAYPGHRFQTGLFGTWMHPQHDRPPPMKLYTDVEGGLGWWRDTRFPTETPKFIMGGVGPNFTEIANGPGHGAGTWEKPRGQYGVAQLSPWLLFPIDGLNLKQGLSGELFGYGYLSLPLLPPKPTTAGKSVPTGGRSWTLFLNAGNFKGPVAFFTPYFWSRAAAADPALAGLLLDERPAGPNRALQMETQYVPALQAADAKGDLYARVAPTAFPRGADGQTVVVHRVTAYDHRALSDAVASWFDGGPAAGGAIAASGTVAADGAVVQTFKGDGGATWKIYTSATPKEERAAIDWKSFATPAAPDPTTFGYRWRDPLIAAREGKPADGKPADGKLGSLVTLPEYYRLVAGKDQKRRWVPVAKADVPPETGLLARRFDRPREAKQKPYETPDDAASCWKTPGPKAGPFEARLGDGSVVTYSWYRFADQPAMLNADLTKDEREAAQTRVAKLHRAWKKDRDYLPPPTVGTLADLDPALIVTPPAGLEVGYVPIATRQEAKD